MSRTSALQARPATPAPAVLATVKSGTVQKKSAAIPVYLQRSAMVSRSNDPAEREADSTARHVMAMSSPVITSHGLGLQRKANDNAAPAAVPSISTSGGMPLSPKSRAFFEPRFKASFKHIRIHADAEAAGMARAINARAFTTGNHVYFAPNAYQPETAEGMELLAHELTHTVQQGAAIQRKEAGQGISQKPASHVQQFGFSDVLDFFADKANIIPGYRMFTVILGVNPINMSKVDRSAANILRAMVEFIPGGYLIAEALDKYKVFEKAGSWVEQQLSELGLTSSAIRKSLDDFIDDLGITDLVRPWRIWERAANIFITPIKGIFTLAKRVGIAILQFIRDAVLMPLAKLAEGTRGWELVCALLGKNPITGEAVPQTAETLVPGFMKLIGKEEVWKRVQEGKALSQIWSWFKGAMADVMAMVRAFPAKFVATLKSLEVGDFIILPKAIGKILGAFGSFVVGFVSWAGNAVWKLLEIIFSVVSPSSWKYIQKLGAALRSILTNPLPFVKNLGKAAKDGFGLFKDGFLGYLQAGIIGWLTGNMPGVYIPKALELKEIARFVLSVLGMTWVNLRAKLVKAIGESAVVVLETTFDIVVTLVRDGPAAAWEQIKTQLTNLKEMAIGAIIDFVVDVVTKKAIPKLISMFIPGLGFISAIMSVYDMVMVFVDKIAQIVQLVTGFVDSIAAIAAGNTSAAAKKIVSVLANGLSLAIVFAAGFASIGRIADKLRAVLEKIRAPFDKAMNWLVGWIEKAAKAVGKLAVKIKSAVLNWLNRKSPVKFADEQHTLQFDGSAANPQFRIHSTPEKPSEFLTRRFDQRIKTDAKIKKGNYVSNTGDAEDKIDSLLKKISKSAIESDEKAISGEERKKLDKTMSDMDKQIGIVGTNVSGAGTKWGLNLTKDTVGDIDLNRGSFSSENKIEIAEQHRRLFETKLVEGQAVPKKKIKADGTFKTGAKLARRHVVSSQDMIDHYKQALKGKTVPEAAILISQRSSIAEARIPISDQADVKEIEAKAKTRYNLFFSYLHNLFIGNADTNSSLGRLRDDNHPKLVGGKKLDDHVARIKREWSFGTGFAVSVVTTQDTLVD